MVDRTWPSDVVDETKVTCDVELPIRVEVNVVLLVSLLGVEEMDDDTEVPEDALVLVKVELAPVVGVVEVSVVGGLVAVALPVVVVVSVVAP